MNSADREFLDIVVADIKEVQRVTQPDADDHDIRRATNILRRFIIEDDLLSAYKLLNGIKSRPVICASKINIPVDTMKKCRFATAGVARLQGARTGFVTFFDQELSNEEITQMGSYLESDHLFPYHEYKDSCSVIVRGNKIKRWQVIGYVANKRGGVHFDPRRKKDEQAFKLLDELHDSNMLVSGKKPLPLELLSIGQYIVQSPDIQSLTEQATLLLYGRPANECAHDRQ